MTITQDQFDFASQVVDFIQVSGATTEKAAAVIEAYEQAEKAASELLPAAVKALLDTGLVLPREQKKAEDFLSTHAGALQALATAVTTQAHNAQRQSVAQGGKAASEKTASARVAGEPREMDREFAQGFIALAGNSNN